MNRGPIRGQTRCRPDGQTVMLFPACSLAQSTTFRINRAIPPRRGLRSATSGWKANLPTHRYRQL